jgi:hypothetical protein
MTEKQTTLPEVLRIVAERLQAVASWADDCMDNKLPIMPAYLDRLAGWVEEDAQELSDRMRSIAQKIRQPELDLEG